MRTNVGKRGISPIIASVLLILIVVTLVSMIFMWSRTFFDSQTQDSELLSKELCSSVDFVAMLDSEEDTLEVANRGNIDISSFEIKTYLNGDSEIIEVDVGVFAGEFIEYDINLGDINSFEKVEIFPVLNRKSSKKSLTCYNDPVLLH